MLSNPSALDGQRAVTGLGSAMKPITTIAFDFDDTLVHNETLFVVTQERFYDLVAPYASAGDVHDRLLKREIANLHLFGYGIKGFTLSMIETAIEVTDGKVPTDAIQEIVEMGKQMLDHPIELLEGVQDTLEQLADSHRLMLITKGDLFDQESKLARTGLGDLFWEVEVVSEKDPETYRRVLDRHDVPADEFLMVGNSVKSDILPVLEIGGRAVHIPYVVTWAHEEANGHDETNQNFVSLEAIKDLPAYLNGGS